MAIRLHHLPPVVLAIAMVFGLFGSARAESLAESPASFEANQTFVYIPNGARERNQPLQVVFALHGMGGEGRGFCQSFLRAADRNAWIVVAPTFRYRNWKDPKTVAEDDIALARNLADLTDALPARYGVEIQPRVELLGFSRGAQLAHRFALAYPERTRAVAAMSAGTYTVPSVQIGQYDGYDATAFPFGTADLAARTGHPIDATKVTTVPYWIAVGADDTRADDVPRQWDRLGLTRVDRARRWTQVMVRLGARAELSVYRGVGHAMSPEMIQGATQFLERLAPDENPPLKTG